LAHGTAMNDIIKFISGFKQFKEQYFSENNDLFSTLRDGQSPRVLLVGCSDSRVDPALLTGCAPGDLFVVRNVANLIPPAEHDSGHHGVSAALEYAVCHLEVEHVIILGHSNCGGIKALLEGAPEGRSAEYIGPWVGIAKRARDQVLLELANKDKEKQSCACEQAAILVSLDNLMTYPWLKERVETGRIILHGWYFDIFTGQLFAYQPVTRQFAIVG
jgi:carbonic anhydrase